MAENDSNPSTTDEPWMRRALELAQRGWGETHPNPMVGAVIVENGQAVAEGWHARAGEAHAEVVALNKLGRRPSKEATLYVTLEPCCTHGRTPPCTEAIIEAGLRHVVVGAIDPNPKHAGRGIDHLQAAGIEVRTKVLERDASDLNLLFNYWVTFERPLLAGKVATTLDGLMATRTGHSQWITGEQARRDVHRWRWYFPAIAVGSGTVLADNPRLTARRDDETWCPRRFVFDRSLRLPLQLKKQPRPHVLTDPFAEWTTLVIDETASKAARKTLQLLHSTSGVDHWVLPRDSFWYAFRQRCREAEIPGVLIEGGHTVLSALLQAEMLDYLFTYQAPRILADEDALPPFTGMAPTTIGDGWHLDEVRHAIFGDDHLVRGFLRRS